MQKLVIVTAGIGCNKPCTLPAMTVSPLAGLFYFITTLISDEPIAVISAVVVDVCRCYYITPVLILETLLNIRSKFHIGLRPSSSNSAQPNTKLHHTPRIHLFWRPICRVKNHRATHFVADVYLVASCIVACR